jgi:predicted nucleic acid-binding Zn ribbon protein
VAVGRTSVAVDWTSLEAAAGGIFRAGMPTYVYRFVDTGETIEIQQSFHDDTLTEAVHPQSGERLPVKKVFQPVGVTFKGDGFYKTDSRASAKKPTDASKSSDATTPDATTSAASSGPTTSTSSGDASSSGSGSGSTGTSSSSASKSTSSTGD